MAEVPSSPMGDEGTEAATRKETNHDLSKNCPDCGVAVEQPDLREEDHIMRHIPTLYKLFSDYLNCGPVPQGYGWTASYWIAQAKRPEYRNRMLPPPLRELMAEKVEEEIFQEAVAHLGPLLPWPGRVRQYGLPD